MYSKQLNRDCKINNKMCSIYIDSEYQYLLNVL